MLASIREFAPIASAIILAGVGGTAITADLGARKIREELDALQVLGVDPIKNLVVPRFLALMVVTGLFNIYALIFGIFGGVLATLTFDAPLGPFFATLLNNASTTDLWGSVVKTTLFGAIIAIVSCYKGMTASGGAEGVGTVGQPGRRDRLPRDLRVQLRLHPDAARHPPRNLDHQVTAADLMELGERMTRVLVIGLLAAAVMAGSALLWIGIPIAGLWARGRGHRHCQQLPARDPARGADRHGRVRLAALPVNALYEQMLGRPEAPPSRSAWLVSSSDERRAFRRARGQRTLLDVSMTASAVAALVLMAIWFFFLAEAPLAPLP